MEIRSELNAMVEKDIREVEYARAIDSAIVYWYQSCDQRIGSAICALAKDVVRIRHEDYAGAGADRYSREPSIQQWMRMTSATQ